MSDLTKLTDDAIQARLSDLSGWERDGDAIVRTWTFGDFNEAFGFLARVALITERQNHHAEIWNVWNRVKLTFSTHDAGGLTEKDFAAAEAISALTGDG